MKVIQDKSESKITKAYVYVIPNELEYLKDLLGLENKLNLKIKIFAVNDKDKYDPEYKAQKKTRKTSNSFGIKFRLL